MAGYLPDSASGRVAVQEVFRLIDQASLRPGAGVSVQEAEINKATTGVENMGDGSIELRDVKFFYPHRQVRVLKRLSFTASGLKDAALKRPLKACRGHEQASKRRFLKPKGQKRVGFRGEEGPVGGPGGLFGQRQVHGDPVAAALLRPAGRLGPGGWHGPAGAEPLLVEAASGCGEPGARLQGRNHAKCVKSGQNPSKTDGNPT